MVREPFASVTIDVSRTAENAHHEHELRVRGARSGLLEGGADPVVADTVADRLAEQVNEGPLPDVTPWIAHQDGTTPFVLAVVDHEGDDVATYVSDVPAPVEQTEAGSETLHISKVPSGGWSQLRDQHVTENVWRQNAEDVAEEIRSAVREGPELVRLAGDPYSRSAAAEHTVTAQDHPALSIGAGRAATLGGRPVAALLRWDQ